MNMEQRPLGRTGADVSVIGLGTWQLGGDWGDVDDDAAAEVLDAALDAGVTLLDTADVYGDGRSEERIRKALAARSDRPFVATKAGRRADPFEAAQYTPENLRAWIDRSRRNLGVDTLDLVQLHCPPPAVYSDQRVYDTLDTLVEEQAIAAYGVSVETVEEGHAGVEGGVEHLGRRVVVDVPPVAAELPGAEPDDRHVRAGPSERSLFHHSPTVARRSAWNRSATGTACCSPERMSLSCPTPWARSRSPITTTCEAPERSAAFIAPLSPRSPYTVSAATPAWRSCPTSRTASRLASATNGTTNACTPAAAVTSRPSACTASSVRSTPTA